MVKKAINTSLKIGNFLKILFVLILFFLLAPFNNFLNYLKKKNHYSIERYQSWNIASADHVEGGSSGGGCGFKKINKNLLALGGNQGDLYAALVECSGPSSEGGSGSEGSEGSEGCEGSEGSEGCEGCFDSCGGSSPSCCGGCDDSGGPEDPPYPCCTNL